ncbi:MAG: adenylate/guanylate cyclase domain-containing protein [Actinomycetes bacterium]
MAVAAGDRSTDLRRHVPHVALTWDDEEPGARWRAVDGTLVFADISGFTALTEKLSARGRIGAEEIIETLNRVFGGMIDAASERGADLLKFGGDALLLLFRGEGHAERACDAAVEMRTALRAAAAVPTSVGRLRLSMSVGIHSGEIYLFLVGEPTRELLVLGDAATQTAEAEKAATAGEIVVSQGTASRLSPTAVKLREDGALLLRRRRPSGPPAGASDLMRVPTTRVMTLFPKVLGEYLDPGPPDPEHRVATIGFVRFSGTDGLLVDGGPDEVADRVHRTVTLMEASLATEGVTMLATDIDSDGGKFFLASGVPQSSEDDDGRMLRALRRFVDADPPLAIQAGVNRGHVFVAEVGASRRAAYSAMGDTTNTAARIMAKAPAGGIYAHPSVLEHAMTLFVTTPAGPFPMKGKAVPLLVYEVGEEAGTRVVGEEARLPFRGRDAELAQVQAVLDGAMTGTGGVATVLGPTGIGKSRLVHEASDAVPDLRAFVLRAEPYGQSSSYRVFRDPLRHLLGVERGPSDVMGGQLIEGLRTVAPDLLPMAPLLADVASVEVPSTPESDAIEPQFRPDALAAALITMLGAARPGPLLIVADGAQWIDRASARLLDRIAWATIDRPWAVVVIRRGEAGGFTPDVGSKVVLEPLNDREIERLIIDATEAAPLRPQEIAAVVSRAEGNPLFVEEVTRVARAVGSLEAMPESLGAAMSVQIDLLAPNARRILRYASVLGRTFRREVLRETLSEEGLHVDHATFSQLAEFLEADGPQRYRFRNSLLRDAAYEELAFRTRARLHQAAGLATERLSADLQVDSPTLALHFSRSGDYPRAWTYGRMSGDVARRAYSNSDAAAQYEIAVEAARHIDVPHDDLIETWSVLGDMRQLSGNPDGAVDALKRAAGLAKEDPVTEGQLLVLRARVQARVGMAGTALRATSRVKHILQSADGEAADRVRVQAECIRALVRLDQNRPAEARATALAVAEDARAVGEAETLVLALMAIDEAEHELGMPVTGEHTNEALEVCVANGMRWRESMALMNLGATAYFRGRWEEALDYFQRSRRVALEAGFAVGAAEAEVNIGDLMISLGRADEAEPVLRDAVRVHRSSRRDSWAATGELQLLRVALARGKYAEAESGLTALITRVRGLDDHYVAIEAELVLAETIAGSGDFARAVDLVDGSELIAEEREGPLRPRIMLVRATALLGLGRLDDSAADIHTGLESARDSQLLYEEATLLALASRVADARGDEAAKVSLAREATVIFDQLGVRT